MSDAFRFLNAINNSKENLIVDDYTENEYIPFLNNRGLSYFPDTVLYANDMNIYNQIDKKLQFEYLLYSISKRKRYSKWYKSEPNENIDFISEVYSCNKTRAKEILSLLTDDQIAMLKEQNFKGG